MATVISHTANIRCPSCPNRYFAHAAALLQHIRDTGHQLQSTSNTNLKPGMNAPLIMITSATPERPKPARRQRPESPTKLTTARARRMTIPLSRKVSAAGSNESTKENAPAISVKQQGASLNTKSGKILSVLEEAPKKPLAEAPVNESKPVTSSKLTASAKPFIRGSLVQKMPAALNVDAQAPVRDPFVVSTPETFASPKTEGYDIFPHRQTWGSEMGDPDGVESQHWSSNSLGLKIGNRVWSSFNPADIQASVSTVGSSRHRTSVLSPQVFSEDELYAMRTFGKRFSSLSQTMPAVHGPIGMDFHDSSFTVPVGFRMSGQTRPSLESLFIQPVPVPAQTYDLIQAVAPSYVADGYVISEPEEEYADNSEPIITSSSTLSYPVNEFVPKATPPKPDPVPESPSRPADTKKSPKSHGFLTCPHPHCGNTRLFTNSSALERHFEATGHNIANFAANEKDVQDHGEASADEAPALMDDVCHPSDTTAPSVSEEDITKNAQSSSGTPLHGWIVCESCPKKLFSSMKTWSAHEKATGHKRCEVETATQAPESSCPAAEVAPVTTDTCVEDEATMTNNVPEALSGPEVAIAPNDDDPLADVDATSASDELKERSGLLSFFSLYPELAHPNDQCHLWSEEGYEATGSDEKEIGSCITDNVSQEPQDTTTNDESLNLDDYSNWQRLCLALGINPPPSTVSACKKAVRSTHVNIVDFYEAWTRNEWHGIRQFGSVGALGRYTRKQKKTMPRAEVKDDGLLRYLLRPIYGGGQRTSE